MEFRREPLERFMALPLDVRKDSAFPADAVLSAAGSARHGAKPKTFFE
jgi:hypothetical protein